MLPGLIPAPLAFGLSVEDGVALWLSVTLAPSVSFHADMLKAETAPITFTPRAGRRGLQARPDRLVLVFIALGRHRLAYSMTDLSSF